MLTIRTTGYEDYLEGGAGKIKILVAGAPGSGKTRLASFAPRPIYAATEDGLMSVADRQVPYAKITSEAEMSAFLDVVEAECRKPADQRRWETVVIDTLDAYERIIIHRYLRKQKREEMDGWEDWGYLSSRMNGFIARLMLIPMNVVILCHVKDVRMKGSDPTLALRLRGDIRDQLPADFDFVGLLENDWGLVDGKRGVIRSITWEATPHAPWLKCRGGGLTTTPVDFADSDFQAIRDGLAGASPTNGPGGRVQEVEVVETDDAPVPAPGPGVTLSPDKKPARKAAAKAPATPLVVPAVPKVVTPPPPTPKPDLRPEETAAAGIAAVEEVLGGEVIRDTAKPVMAQPQKEGVSTPVQTPTFSSAPDATPVPEAPTAAPEPTPDPESVEVEQAQTVEDLKMPESGTVKVFCGSARFEGSPVKAPCGCGKPLVVTLDNGRVVGVEGVDAAELVEIAGLRERAFLHNECYAQLRRARANAG